MGSMDAPFHQVIEQATAFISACYGIQNSSDMSHTRLLAWGKKNGKGHTSAPNLAALPPTKEAFLENVKRAHFQSALWRNVDGRIPPAWDPENFGWDEDIPNRTLNPTTLPAHCKAAPDYILDMIKCGCKSELPCSSKKCSCRVHGLPCTMACQCFSVGCSRRHIKSLHPNSAHDYTYPSPKRHLQFQGKSLTPVLDSFSRLSAH